MYQVESEENVVIIVTQLCAQFHAFWRPESLH